MKWNDELLNAHDQQVLRKNLADQIAAGETHAALRRAAAQAAMKQLESDAKLQPIHASLAEFGRAQAELAQALATSEVSRRYAERQLRERWAVVDRPEVRAALQPLFDRIDADGATRQRIEALFGKDRAEGRAWVERDWFGEYLYGIGRDRQPLDGDADKPGGGDHDDPAPAPDPTPAPAPSTVCSTSFDLPPRTAQTHDGPGASIISVSAGPGTAGRFYTFSGAVLILAGGVGVQTMGAVGRSAHWSAGFSTLEVKATVDYSCLLYGHMLGLGLSTSSSELFVEVLVDNGPSVRVALQLAALVAPVAWGAEWRRQDRAVLRARVAIPQAGGSARIYAGGVSSAATGGAALTAGCWGSVSGTVSELCISLA